MSDKPEKARSLVMDEFEQRKHERSKSKVRIRITQFAAIFLFGFSMLLIGWLMLNHTEENGYMTYAMRIFYSVLPVAAGIITYWFSARSNEKHQRQSTGVE